MQTWWILFAANLLLPLMMLGIGGWFGKHPPRKINHFVGYRTPMSTVSYTHLTLPTTSRV